MSRGVNKVIIIGTLGQDPEVRYMPNGGAVANISVATTERWKDKNTQEQKEETEWHRVVFYQRLAEIVGEYLRKGSKVYLEGKLKTRKWQDKDGVDRYTTEIIANDMQMLSSKDDGQQGGQRPAQGHSQGQGQRPAQGGQQQPRRPAQQQGAQQQGAPAQLPKFDHPVDFDDDIPF